MAANGASTESKLQEAIQKLYPSTPVFKLPCPDDAGIFAGVELRCMMMGATPTVATRDEKHCLKTIRSATETGARALTMADDTVGFADFLALVGNDKGLLTSVAGSDATNKTINQSTAPSLPAFSTSPSKGSPQKGIARAALRLR